MAYKDMGYLPDAMVNYLVRLGWSHGDQELFSRTKSEKFSWKNVQTRPAVFNLTSCCGSMPNISKPIRLSRWRKALVPLLEQTDLKDEVRAVSTEWLAQLWWFW